jgi:hypothetical protein
MWRISSRAKLVLPSLEPSKNPISMACSPCAELPPMVGKTEWNLLLLRMGTSVNGGYSNGKIDGFIEGEVREGMLHFTWREGNAIGKGVAQAQGETLRGTWGIGEAEQGGGEWTALRQKKQNTGR